MIFRKSGFLSGVDWMRHQHFENLVQYPSQLPMDNTPGRFVHVVDAYGTGPGLTDTEERGVAVFDFNDGLNKYELTHFTPIDLSSAALSWAHWSRSQAMVNATTFIVTHEPDNDNATTYRGVVTINAAGEATLAQDWEVAGTMNADYVVFSSSESCGYNGNLYYGYYARQYLPTYTNTTNGWVDKVTTSGYTAMSGALQTGYTGNESNHGQPGLDLAMLGYGSPNGYLVVSAPRDDHETVVRYALVNATGTPSKVTEVTWSDDGYYSGLVPLSSTKVIAIFKEDSATYGSNYKCALLYTNSATTPTTLTKGAECSVPDPPAWTGISAEDVTDVYFTTSTCSNYKSKENKVLILCGWKVNDAESYYVPCIVESTSNTNLTATIPSEDIWGNLPTIIAISEQDGLFIVGAPDNKATLMWIIDGETYLNQQTFQL